MYYIGLSNNNIVDISSDHSQVLRISCDAPLITDQTTEQTTLYSSTTETSNNVEYSSIITTKSRQTTDSLQLTTMIRTEDNIANEHITGNIIGINVMNRHTIMKLTKHIHENMHNK